MILVLLALAAAVGACARYGATSLVTRLAPEAARWGTFGVNVAGAFALGLLVGSAQAGLVSTTALTVLGAGLLGSFTTFSTWTVEAVELIERRAYGAAVVHVLGSVALGVPAAYLGLRIGGAW